MTAAATVQKRGKKKRVMIILLLLLLLMIIVRVAACNKGRINENEDMQSPVQTGSSFGVDDSISESEMNDKGDNKRQKNFEKIVKKTAKSVPRLTITSINNGFVHFDWETKKGVTDLFIEFDTDPGEIA